MKATLKGQLVDVGAFREGPGFVVRLDGGEEPRDVYIHGLSIPDVTAAGRMIYQDVVVTITVEPAEKKT